ncbi:MAG: hypothetical protein PSX71_12135 [bacterium]|nr:hypothetical protein [bacterium]
MTELFNVVFSGELSGRADPAAVRANVGKLFNASEAVLDKLFSGQPVAVKKMVDRATAMKVRALMKQAGAEARMVAVAADGRALAAAPAAVPAAAPPPQAPKAPPPPSGTMAARVESLAEQHDREALTRPKPNAPPPPAVIERVETWAMYPVGSLLSMPVARAAPFLPKITGISIAATGANILADNERPVIKPVQVDISGISVAAVGSDVLKENERQKVAPVVVDISGMSMADVGAPLDEIREKKVLVNPDISHIALVKD